MDVKLTYKSLKKFLKTSSDAEEIASKVSLCGPTFDRIHQLGQDDYLFEIESITNRVDTACALGVARETVATLNQFGQKSTLINDPYQDQISLPKLPNNTLKIKIDNPKDIIRFCAITLSNVNISDSPPETKALLNATEQRPINNAVDITNEVTLLYGMPSHIFDLDKITDQEITLRNSKAKEKVTTLDGISNTLQGSDLVIEDNQGHLIDLCGVMGGNQAEVDEKTKNILLIVPVYNPKKIRKTSLYLQKRTLAAQIYEKQPDPEIASATLNYLVKLFKDRTNATPTSQVFDFYPNPYQSKTIELDLNWLSNFIGIEIKTDKIKSILQDLGFSSTNKDTSTLNVSVPSYRQFDINIKEDLAEEISRIYGYFQLPAVLPTSILKDFDQEPIFAFENDIKKYLSNIGYAEVYNLSLISQKQIEQANLQIKDFLQLSNPLSQDYVFLRNTLLISLLQNYQNNQNGQIDNINFFEVSNIYQPKKQLPEEISTLALITDKPFFQAKGDLESLLDTISVQDITFKNSSSNSTFPILNPNQTAEIYHHKQKVGSIGTVNPKILNQLEISTSKDITVVQVNLKNLILAKRPNPVYTPISTYPDKTEEINVVSDLPIGELITQIYNQDNLIRKVSYLNSYQNKHTFKLTMSSFTGNLTQETADKIKSKISEKLNLK